MTQQQLNSKAFSKGSFYIMRHGDLYMIIDCVPADPKAPSGHKHNSRLSFELFAYGKSFIIDPGAYIYTADKEMRNLFRSTKYHNTVVVDDKEQNRFDLDALFHFWCDATTTVNRWVVTDEYDFFDGEHSGYKRLNNPVIHQRQIYFDKIKGYWIIKDVMKGKGGHQFDLYFHFSPLKVKLDREFPLVIKAETEGSNLAVIPLEIEGLSVEISEGWVSYRYGVKERAPIVRYSKRKEASTGFITVIYPYKRGLEIERVMEIGRKKVRTYSSL